MYLLNRRGVYYVEYFDATKNKTRRLSTKKRTREEAVDYVSHVFPSHELNDKPKVAETAKVKVEQKLLSVFALEYSSYIGKIYSKKYLTSVKLSFRILIEHVGDKPISKITVRELDNFFMVKFSEAKFAAHLYLRTLQSAFNRAIQWELISENPFLKIRLGRLPKNNPLYLSEEELSMILKACANPKLRDMIKFAFYTGMRLGEIINLKKDAVQLEEGIIRVRNTSMHVTKGKSERYIPIAEKIKSIVTSWMSKSETYLFTMNGTFPYKGDYLTKGFKKIITNLTLSNEIHFHTLRHSFASYLAIQGVSLYVVKELLGHKDISTTQIYAHLSTDSLKKAIDLF